MYKYKTKNGEDYFLPGHGQTVGGEITTDSKIENPNFILVEEPKQIEPAPNHITGVAPQNIQPAPIIPTTESEGLL